MTKPTPTPEDVERVARAIAPLVCSPVHNGDCDDVAVGQDFARKVARAAIAALPTRADAPETRSETNHDK